MRAFVVFLVSCCFATVIIAQDTTAAFDGHTWKAPYFLPTPKDWGVERFQVPISFAPEITYTGVEDIRFTPGWAKAESTEYWSYAFLWYLDGNIRPDAGTVAANLTKYYTGLVKINGANVPAEKIVPVETLFNETKAERGDLKTFIGTVTMTDYVQQKPVTLTCKVHVKQCAGENKTYLFHELSPQPVTHSVWQSLDRLWVGFSCGASNQ